MGRFEPASQHPPIQSGGSPIVADRKHDPKPRRLASRLGAVAITILLVSGCAAPPPELPPLQTGTTLLPGKVIWHDLVTPDMDQAKAFYGELLGWTFEDVAGGYALALNGTQPVAGIAKLNSAWNNSYWIPLVSVPNVDAAAQETNQAGGEILREPFDLVGRGRVAVVRDPQGAVFAMVHNDRGDPVDSAAGLNQWFWNEIWSDDVASSAAFYSALVGYRTLERTIDGTPYVFLSREGKPRVGLVQKPDPQIGNTWVAYLRVADAATITGKAESLGGRVLLAPQPAIRNGTLGIVTDPHGAGFVVQEREQGVVQ